MKILIYKINGYDIYYNGSSMLDLTYGSIQNISKRSLYDSAPTDLFQSKLNLCKLHYNKIITSDLLEILI